MAAGKAAHDGAEPAAWGRSAARGGGHRDRPSAKVGGDPSWEAGAGRDRGPAYFRRPSAFSAACTAGRAATRLR
jgi:hypothetical protein